jgi:hypothetical protein
LIDFVANLNCTPCPSLRSPGNHLGTAYEEANSMVTIPISRIQISTDRWFLLSPTDAVGMLISRYLPTHTRYRYWSAHRPRQPAFRMTALLMMCCGTLLLTFKILEAFSLVASVVKSPTNVVYS